jgi:hypothetical protein
MSRSAARLCIAADADARFRAEMIVFPRPLEPLISGDQAGLCRGPGLARAPRARTPTARARPRRGADIRPSATGSAARTRHSPTLLPA